MAWDKHTLTHENVHEKLDGIEIEGCTSHLSDPSHLTRPVYAGDVQLKSPLTSALSDIAVVSKPSTFVRAVQVDSRSSLAAMDPDRSLSTEMNHDQSLNKQKSSARARSNAIVHPRTEGQHRGAAGAPEEQNPQIPDKEGDRRDRRTVAVAVRCRLISG
jgi:hypothetical protein